MTGKPKDNVVEGEGKDLYLGYLKPNLNNISPKDTISQYNNHLRQTQNNDTIIIVVLIRHIYYSHSTVTLYPATCCLLSMQQARKH